MYHNCSWLEEASGNDMTYNDKMGVIIPPVSSFDAGDTCDKKATMADSVHNMKDDSSAFTHETIG